MNFKNIGAIIMGKPPVNKRPEVNKMNNIDKKSVKSEIKYLESKTAEKSIKNKMKEKIR